MLFNINKTPVPLTFTFPEPTGFCTPCPIPSSLVKRDQTHGGRIALAPVSFGLYLIYALTGQTPSIFLSQWFQQRTLPGPLSHLCPNSLRILSPGASYQEIIYRSRTQWP